MARAIDNINSAELGSSVNCRVVGFLFLLLIGVIGTSLMGCENHETSVAGLQPSPDRMDPQLNSVVSEFERLIGADELDTADALLQSADKDERRRITRRLLDSDLPGARVFAIGALIDAGCESDAVPQIAAAITRGVDISGLSFAWLHSADQTLFSRMHLAIAQNLAEAFSALKPHEQAAAAKYIEDVLSMYGREAESDKQYLREIRAIAEKLGPRPPSDRRGTCL